MNPLDPDRQVPELTDVQRTALIGIWAAEQLNSHSPRTGPHGESCDEMGCPMCNGGDEYVEWVVMLWLEGPQRSLDPHDAWRDFPWPDDEDLVDAAQSYMAAHFDEITEEEKRCLT